MRDPDPKRRRVALDAITNMDGWIYLVAAGKAETGVISDLNEIRDEGHNLHGVVCISKVNLLNDPTASKTLEELAAQQRGEFQRFSAMPITYDSAMARAQFALIRETAEGSDDRFVLLRDILDQSYGFGFIRRLVPALRDRSFSDPLKLAFQHLVEQTTGHGAASNTQEFQKLEDVLTETSLLITTMRNIAELLQEKIVRRVASNKRLELIGAVNESNTKLLQREAFLVELIGWMDAYDATLASISTQQGEFLAAKKIEQMVMDAAACLSEQFALKVGEQMAAARSAATHRVETVDNQVESWFRQAYSVASTTRQTMVDGEEFTIRSMVLPLHDLFDLPVSESFAKVLGDVITVRSNVVATCSGMQSADNYTGIVEETADIMGKSMVAAVETLGNVGFAILGFVSKSNGRWNSHACWCTTNVVSRDRSHCKNTICITVARNSTEIIASSSEAPPTMDLDIAEVSEGLRATKALALEQSTAHSDAMNRYAELQLENILGAGVRAQVEYTKSYRSRSSDLARAILDLEVEAEKLAAKIGGDERADVEAQVEQRRADMSTLGKFHGELSRVAGFDVHLSS